MTAVRGRGRLAAHPYRLRRLRMLARQLGENTELDPRADDHSHQRTASVAPSDRRRLSGSSSVAARVATPGLSGGVGGPRASRSRASRPRPRTTTDRSTTHGAIHRSRRQRRRSGRLSRRFPPRARKPNGPTVGVGPMVGAWRQCFGPDGPRQRNGSRVSFRRRVATRRRGLAAPSDGRARSGPSARDRIRLREVAGPDDRIGDKESRIERVRRRVEGRIRLVMAGENRRGRGSRAYAFMPSAHGPRPGSRRRERGGCRTEASTTAGRRQVGEQGPCRCAPRSAGAAMA